MPELSFDLIIPAPADEVWDVIGPGFDRFGGWASAVLTGTGRVCQTGIRLVPQVTETLTAYDDAARSLTYEASGMPAFVTLARNTWTVTPIDADRCRVSLHARFDTRGFLGVLGRWAILTRARRTSRHLADDLRHYLETGEPSPRKQRQQRPAMRPRSSRASRP
jgi:hypothetical protein